MTLPLHTLSLEQLKKLSTKNILAFKRKWQPTLSFAQYEYYECYTEDEDCKRRALQAEQQLKDIKTVLSTREHIPRRGKPSRRAVF